MNTYKVRSNFFRVSMSHLIVWALVAQMFVPPVLADTLVGSQSQTISSFTSTSQIPGYLDTQKMLNTSSTASFATGTTYYVSMTGSDSANGSQANAWRTLSRAVSQLKAGDTLFIEEGTYQQSANLSASGTQDAYITIQGLGHVIFDGTALDSYDPIIDTNGHDYIKVKNIEVRNARSLMHIEPGSHHIGIENIVARNTQFAVWMDSASDVDIRNVYAIDSRNGFRAQGTTHDVTFENIEVYRSKEDNLSDGGYLNGDGFIFEGDTYNLTFRNVITAYNADAGMDIKGDNVLIENVVSYSNTMGLKLWGVNVTVVNALIVASKDQLSSSGLYTGAVGINVRTGAARVYNSTIVDNQSRDVKAASGATLHLENCIVTRNISTGSLKSAAGPITEKNVLWYRAGATQPDFTIPTGSLWANPGFVDWQNGDFRLMSTSAAIDRGLNNAVLPAYDLDLEDRIYGSVVDLGAFEYQPVSTQPNRAPSVTAIPDMTASEDSAVLFSLSALDPDGDSLTYSASNLPAGAALNAATGQFSWTPSFSQAGNYTLLFSVSDGALSSDLAVDLTIINVNRPPAFQSVGDQSVQEGDMLLFSVNANDPDGDALAVSALGLPQGAVFDSTTRIFSWTPGFEQAGSYSVTFRATDGTATTDKTVVMTVGDVATTLPPTTTTDIVAVATVNTQNYNWVSGTVYKYGSDILAMYGKRTVAYDLVMSEAGTYFIKVSTAQATSKEIPYAGYLFDINVYVDDVLVGNYDLSAQRTYIESAQIALGSLTQGVHRVKLQWTNDLTGTQTNQNSDLGLKGLVLLKETVVTTVTPSVPTVDTTPPALSFDPNLPAPSLINTTSLAVAYVEDGVSKTLIFTSLNEGLNNLTITASDAAGNTATLALAVTVDTIAPAIVLDPATPTTIQRTDATTPVSGVIDYTSDGVARTWSYTDLVDGTNTITITETDAAGNTATRTHTITVLAYVPPAPAPAPRTIPGSETPVATYNMQNYTGASGTVYKYSGGALVMYGERTVSYTINTATSDDYFIRLWTAQATSKNAPYAGYEFSVNIYVDGQLIGTYDLSATKTYTQSPYIALGELSEGTHTLSIEWTNDISYSSSLDSNLGMKDLSLYR